jgi:hypothetical protein
MSDGTWTISESGNSIDNIEAREYDPYPARTIAVPRGYAAYIYPVAISGSATDDGAQILDHIAGPLRGAAAHVQDLIDHDERNDIDG